MCGIIGIVFFEWALCGINDLVTDSVVESWQAGKTRKHRRNNFVGFLHYKLSAIHTRGNGCVAIPSDELHHDTTLSSTWYLQQRRSKFNGKRLEQHLQESEIAAPSHTFVVSRQLAELLVKGLTETLSIIPLGRRQFVGTYMFAPVPAKKSISRWVRKQREVNNSADGEGSVSLQELARRNALYELPPNTPNFPQKRKFAGGLEPGFDAVRVLKYLKVGPHLRTLGNFEAAIGDVIEAACATRALADTVMEQLPECPKRSGLYAARLKLDAITMGVERRFFQRLIRKP
jgi:hypothetical protein